MTELREVWQALFRLCIVLLDLISTGIPAVRACLALRVIFTNLVRRSQLGARVIPGPGTTLLTEESLGTVYMTVAMDTDLVPFALAINAIASLALETVRAASTVVQILVERGDFSAVRLRALVCELRIGWHGCVCITAVNALREFVYPGEFSVAGCEVTGGDHIDFYVAFFVSDVPFTVVRSHYGHWLILFNFPAEVVVYRLTENWIVTLKYWASNFR